MAFGELKGANLSNLNFDVLNTNFKSLDTNFNVDVNACQPLNTASFVSASAESQNNKNKESNLEAAGNCHIANGSILDTMNAVESAFQSKSAKITDEELEKYGITREEYEKFCETNDDEDAHPLLAAIATSGEKLISLCDNIQAMSDDFPNHLSQKILTEAYSRGYLKNGTDEEINNQIMDELSNYVDNGVVTPFIRYLLSKDEYFENFREKNIEYKKELEKYNAEVTTMYELYGCNEQEIAQLLSGELKFDEWYDSIINSPDYLSDDPEVKDAALGRMWDLMEGMYLLYASSIVRDEDLETFKEYFYQNGDSSNFYGGGDLFANLEKYGFTRELFQEIIDSPTIEIIDFKQTGTMTIAMLSYMLDRFNYYDDNGNFIGYTNSDGIFITDEDKFLNDSPSADGYYNYYCVFGSDKQEITWSYGDYEKYCNENSYWSNEVKTFIASNSGLSADELKKAFVLKYYYKEIEHYIESVGDKSGVEDFVNNNGLYFCVDAILCAQGNTILLSDFVSDTIKPYYEQWVNSVIYYTDTKLVISRDDVVITLPDQLLDKLENNFNECTDLEKLLAILTGDVILKYSRGRVIRLPSGETGCDYSEHGYVYDKDGNLLGMFESTDPFIFDVLENYHEYERVKDKDVSGLSAEEQEQYKSIEFLTKEDINYWVYLYNTQSSDYVIDYLYSHHYDPINDKIVTMRDMRIKSFTHSMYEFIKEYQYATLFFDPLSFFGIVVPSDIIWRECGNDSPPPIYPALLMGTIGVSILPLVLAESLSVTFTAGALHASGNNMKSYQAYSYTSKFREAIGSELAESIDWDSFSTLYSVITSVCDSLALMFATMYSGGAALVVQAIGISCLASMSFQQTLFSALERGVEFKSAYLLAIIAFVAESVFEKIGMDAAMGKLFQAEELAAKAAAQGAKTGIKFANILVNRILIPGLSNLGEEVLTDICNRVADDLLAGDLSEYKLAIGYYLSTGCTYDEATKKASHDFAVQLAITAIAGFASGVAMGNIASAIQTKQRTANSAGQAATSAPGMIMEEDVKQRNGSIVSDSAHSEVNLLAASQIKGTAASLSKVFNSVEENKNYIKQKIVVQQGKKALAAFQGEILKGASSDQRVVNLMSTAFSRIINNGNLEAVGVLKKLTKLKKLNPKLRFISDPTSSSHWTQNNSEIVLNEKVLADCNFNTLFHEIGHCLFDSVLNGKLPKNWVSTFNDAAMTKIHTPGLLSLIQTMSDCNKRIQANAQQVFEQEIKRDWKTMDAYKARLYNYYSTLLNNKACYKIELELKLKQLGYDDYSIKKILANNSFDANDLVINHINNQIRTKADSFFRTQYGGFVATEDIIDAVFIGEHYDMHGNFLDLQYGHGREYYINRQANSPMHEIIANFTLLKLTDNKQLLEALKTIFGEEFYNTLDDTFKKLIN